MRPIDTMETGPGASSALRTADAAQRHSDYSLHYKWLKQSRGPAEATASGETLSRYVFKAPLQALFFSLYHLECPNDQQPFRYATVYYSFFTKQKFKNTSPLPDSPYPHLLITNTKS